MKKVLIYCASGAGERAAYTLNEDAYQVVGLVDSNPETWGKPLYGMGGYWLPTRSGSRRMTGSSLQYRSMKRKSGGS